MSETTTNQGNGPDGSSETKTKTIEDLKKIDDNSIKEMKVDEMKSLCKRFDLPQKGNKKTLLETIFLAMYGYSDTYVRLMTVCKICNAGVKVLSTKKGEPMEDGRVMVTRQLKCIGKRHHTYPLKNIIGVAAKPEK